MRWHKACVAEYLFARKPDNYTVAAKSNYRCAGCSAHLRAFSHRPAVVDPEALKLYERADYHPHTGRSVSYGYLLPFARHVVGPLCPVEFEPIFCEDVTQPPKDNGVHPFHYLKADGAYSAVDSHLINFHIDHTAPLWSVDRSLPFRKLIKFWLLGNLSALCLPCHKAKTAREATQRAVLRKKVAQPELAL